MIRLPLFVFLGVLAAGCTPGPSREREPARRLVAARPACEPTAPLEIRVAPPAILGDRLVLDVVLVPGVDVLELRLDVRLPDGGSLLGAAPRSWGARSAGTDARSLVRVAPPDVPGVAVELVAVARLADASSPDGVGRMVATRRLKWGASAPDVLGSEVRTRDPLRGTALVSRDAPALHRPAGGAGR